MKRIKEEFRRTVKYWRITYEQATGRERMFIGLLVLIVLAYTWWAVLVF